ncbi:MAG TPA: septum formation inhibitor Maf [Planctomycetaceae bacterium]|nr:septum formation inhibitor Maf [Planctomycetaceae bacterium]HCC99989.1 septum formation inhibitor Maf [Planctomycetaceae bacterium]
MSDFLPRIVLGSRSPRRRQLLAQLVGEERIEVLPPSSVEEAGFDDTDDRPSIHRRLLEIARAKADDVRLQLGAQRRADGIAAVLSADTVIVVSLPGGALGVLGQPPEPDWQDVVREWFRDHYLGRTHTAATAICVVSGSGLIRERVVESQVTFRDQDPEWLESYLECGESVGKAGGYAIQGRAGEAIERVEGSTDNVVGLPTEAVAEMLDELGIDVD